MRGNARGEAERPGQSIRDATCIVPIRIRPHVHAKQPSRLADFRFDLRGRELVLHVREKILCICIICERTQLHRESAGGCGDLGSLGGGSVGEAGDQSQIVDSIVNISGAIGGLLAIYGRLTANAAIR